ncbi:uncharacterized protein G2W53_037278 [Senna tora]|uniref:Uncharacterized protein n=1 Tax=Senna tora TaxID=362788 RepID=A0A834SUI9_9FABA|nr:uncharacterized protein G2W53_037278 [Senna tora]
MEHSLRAKKKQRRVETPSSDVTNDSATRGFNIDNEEFEEENIEIELANLSNLSKLWCTIVKKKTQENDSQKDKDKSNAPKK